MAFTEEYTAKAPELEEVEQTQGPLVLEFGTSWCGHCRAAQPFIEEAFTSHADIPHWKIEDGKGRRLGRAFRIKLWPTLVFLEDGKEIDRLVRPGDAVSVDRALDRLGRDSDKGG